MGKNNNEIPQSLFEQDARNNNVILVTPKAEPLPTDQPVIRASAVKLYGSGFYEAQKARVAAAKAAELSTPETPAPVTPTAPPQKQHWWNKLGF